MRRVREVERFGAKLHADPLSEFELAEDTHVQVDETRSPQYPDAACAETWGSWVYHVGVGEVRIVPPTVNAANFVYGPAAVGELARARRVQYYSRSRRGDRSTRVQSSQRVELPAT